MLNLATALNLIAIKKLQFSEVQDLSSTSIKGPFGDYFH